MLGPKALRWVKKILLPLGVVSFLIVIFLGFQNFRDQELSVKLERQALDFKLDLASFYETLLVNESWRSQGLKKTINRDLKITSINQKLISDLQTLEKKNPAYAQIELFQDFKAAVLEKIAQEHENEILTRKIRHLIGQINLQVEKQLIYLEEENTNRYDVVRLTAFVGSLLGLLLILIFSRVNSYEFEKRMEVQEDLKKSNQAATNLSELKSQFLATVSHELRTPLNGILGMSDLLIRKMQGHIYFESIKTIHDSAQNLLKIVNEILEFSKNEASPMTFEISEFSIFDLVEGSIHLFSARAREKKITISSFIDARFQAAVMGDFVKINQVLNNLINNALKFTTEGEVSVRVFWEGQSEDQVLIKFEVQDTGIGIDRKKIPFLFQPFHQIINKNHKRESGTGLGLSIAKQIIESMRGKIGVESEPAQGSKFWFRLSLPLSEPDHGAKFQAISKYSRVILFSQESMLIENLKMLLKQFSLDLVVYKDIETFFKHGVQNKKNEEILFLVSGSYPVQMFNQPFIKNICFFTEEFIPIDTFPGQNSMQLAKPMKGSILIQILTGVMNIARPSVDKGLRDVSIQSEFSILVAEDNITNQQLVEAQLAELGYSATVVSDGQLAVKNILINKFDLILMDCQMPIMDGFEATKNIRLHESSLGYHTPIVAMTANASQEDREYCLSQGMDDFLSKPFVLDQLSEILDRWISKEGEIKRAAKTAEGYLQDLSPETVEKLKSSFRKSLEVSLEEVKVSRQQKNWSEFKRIVHRLKSSAALFHQQNLVEICDLIEKTDFESLDSEAQNQGASLYEKFQSAVVQVMEEFGN